VANVAFTTISLKLWVVKVFIKGIDKCW
jgi:hypothetical protein